ncbi:MAG: redoxin domain-containing protein, partial [Deltaproteobacteria bacterium]|nr:redoxin domain-containing protein [Deltaproteobacteria bacterium]
LAISPDKPEKIAASKKANKQGYELYSDSGADAMKAFGVAFKLDEETVKLYKENYGIDIEADSGQNHHLLPVPSVFIINQAGKIVYVHSNPDYKVRLSAEEILNAIKKLKS